jgi:hypothetical protein
MKIFIRNIVVSVVVASFSATLINSLKFHRISGFQNSTTDPLGNSWDKEQVEDVSKVHARSNERCHVCTVSHLYQI